MAANIIGLLLGAVTMIPFLESLMPDQADQTTTVRIGVGLSTNNDANTKGNTPGIALFDVVGRSVGTQSGSSDTIADGGFSDIKVIAPDDAAGRQAEYISVSKGGNDALCIAYISMAWPDGGKRAWYGDVGMQCGGFWYHSETIAGDDDYRPACVWIDGDASNGIVTQGMGIHITDFTATAERADAYAADQDTMCKSKPRFNLYNDITSDDWLPVFVPPLEYESGTLVDTDRSKLFVTGIAQGAPPQSRRRSIIEARGHSNTTKPVPFMPHRLITSKHPSHSAIKLCKSKTSKGPDFVSYHEGVFCDMCEKEVWPLCSESLKGGCFDVLKGTMRPGSGLNGRDESSGRQVPEKSYTKIDHW